MIKRVDKETGEIYAGVFLRTQFNYDMNAASDETALDCSDSPSMTQQQFAEEVNINTIVERFGLTGELPENLRVPQSGDFSNVANDYHSAMNLVKEAQEAFMEMPAHIRTRFDNDPGKFIAFTEDPGNKEEARKMGILVPEKTPPEPIRVRVEKEPEAP